MKIPTKNFWKGLLFMYGIVPPFAELAGGSPSGYDACPRLSRVFEWTQPLQPSFSQSAYNIKAGQSVTFTYTGPEQPKGVELYWATSLGEDQQFVQDGFGSSITFTYSEVGSWGVTLKAYNCNSNQPRVDIFPCVKVSP